MALSVKKLTWMLAITALASGLGAVYEVNRVHQIQAFNTAVSEGKSPQTDMQSFEAKFSTAYWLARKERYKESTLLFLQLAEKGDANQRSAIQHNLGNIFFLRGLAINGTNLTVRNEAEYLLRQAKSAYQLSLRQDNSHWDTRHNLDRVLTMLPATPTPGVGESDSPGLIMGNIPVGLP
jgi:mxaK protein